MLRVRIVEQRAQEIVHRGRHRSRDLAATRAGEVALGQLRADRFEIGASDDAGSFARNELREQGVRAARRRYGGGGGLDAIRAGVEAHKSPAARSPLK